MCKKAILTALLFTCWLPSVLLAQKNQQHQYPSLLWEITGNGMKKPSYLFGTMHVSSKMVFHLSDSFYLALKQVDAVALELNPEVWQGQMARMEQLKKNYAAFVQPPVGTYLNENSFRYLPYENDLKTALSTEPAMVNSLLYRSFKSREDFEEDTFLDLYIYQTGKKLGKHTTGVEDYYETEKIILQAYADMAKEKKKKSYDFGDESMYDINEKMQDAYRRGDLDLLDSLNDMTEQSAAFREKFLYLRNEIQANSMDSIMKKGSLFTGVGAAHLPGPRGVIELLRKKGYKLRPVKMANRDAAAKEETDKMKVPVVFSSMTSDDGFYTADMPGQLYKMSSYFERNDMMQYSDMSNGSYYLVSRVKTHAAVLGQTEETVKKKIDSLLYENIPGKILKKTAILKNGYTGYDITNKTRRGDLQRYNIFITPFEVLIFKMSGKENYISGTEAERFFSSIKLKEAVNSPLNFTPPQGGFTVWMPQIPAGSYNTATSDNASRWDYEAFDRATGDAYTIIRKPVHNFAFLDEDSFDLKLVEESFRSPDFFERQLSRNLSLFNGYPCLDVKEKMKDSSIVQARFIIKGPQYYVIAARSKNGYKDFSRFFNSFRFTPYIYSKPKAYTDTFMHFSVTTPVTPELDDKYRAVLEQSLESNSSNYYRGRSRNALFFSDSTGEAIGVGTQQYPVYAFEKDSAAFWKNEMEERYNEKDLVLYKKEFFAKDGGIRGCRFSLGDTGSSRTINRVILLKDDYVYSFVSMGDTINGPSSFTDSFYNSFIPVSTKPGRDIFKNCTDSFFADFFSADSATHAKAQKAIPAIRYSEQDVPKIISTIQKLKPTDKDYFENKTAFITELGFINDSTLNNVNPALKKIYEQTTDTSTFQNAVIEALARHKTTASAQLFKEIVLQDPPVFDNDYEYSSIFNALEDSLQLAASLYPEILQLTALEDYKEPVFSLLVTLIDSGFIKADNYESWFSKIYFDAKVELKKQMAKDDKQMEAEAKKEEDDNDYAISYTGRYNNYRNKSDLENFAVLLAPFYSKNTNVPKFFEKLLHSRDEQARINAAVVLLKNKQQVADSILLSIASKDLLRGKLYSRLEKINRLDKFPAAYKTQQALAKSYLVMEKEYNKIDSAAFISKHHIAYKDKKGFVYFFKYRAKKDDGWKIGISGLQPEKENEVSSDREFTQMTEKKIKTDEPLEKQLEEQLKKLLFSMHSSGRYFFETNRYNYRFSDYLDTER
ncbi:MAG: TraB/GumN family protein [Ferruginibacter sp.]